MQVHGSITESARRQTEADPCNWEVTYRQMVLYDLASDMELGFFLAYYRNFAIPSIAATLHQNGEIIERPMKRSYDTAIVTYELITSGMNSDRGRHMIRLLNNNHRHVPGSQDDFLYVLLTLLVVPIRWARAHAWRAPAPAEETAATRFYQELGARMNIAGTPQHSKTRNGSSIATSETTSPTPRRCTTDGQHSPSLEIQATWAREAIDQTNALRHVRRRPPHRCPRPPRATQLSKTILNAVLTTRSAIHRRRPLSTEPHFVPGQAGSSLYPNGYRLDDIGPENVMSPADRPDH
ncbi:DUF2236 domain-containing protein [Arthrobacter alpinus]|nr:DUF2236 domain-containing protein [Arthrobacter alpinus]